MADPARARRLAKRIGTVVASAIEFEIKDPPLAFVTVTDTKVTGLATTVAMNAADALTLSNAKAYTDGKVGESSETLVASATATNDDASTLAERKEPLSTVERIKMEREYEKANPKEPLKPAEGIWKSKWMVVPAAILYGFGG